MKVTNKTNQDITDITDTDHLVIIKYCFTLEVTAQNKSRYNTY